MDKDQMFRKMSKLGIKGPDNLLEIQIDLVCA